MARDTFTEFLDRNPRFKPFAGEPMFSVYSKQIEGFSAYADEQVALKLAEIDEVFALPADALTKPTTGK